MATGPAVRAIGRVGVATAGVAALALLVLVGGCADSGGPVDSPSAAQAADAVEAGLLTEDDLPSKDYDWFEIDAEQEAFANRLVLQECGSLDWSGAVEAEVLDDGTSDLWRGEGDYDDGSISSAEVGSAVYVYDDTDAAEAAIDLLLDEGADGYDECVGDAILQDVEEILESGEYDGDPGNLDLLDVEVDDLEVDPDDELGDQAVLLQATFPEEIFGGYDDANAVDVLVSRSGPALVVVAVSASGQNLDADEVSDLAEDLAPPLLERVTAELD